MEAHKFKTVDEYISSFPPEVRPILEKLRQTIIKAAPKAEEVISYNMPAFKLNGALVYYAAYKKHVGFYPTNSGITEFADELADYKTSKGAIQFPLDKPLPTGLITKIVKFRIVENNAKALVKKQK
ncbi:PF08818 domain protein [Sporocytophaga myxococcoides]|uniref:PF08818 domain protein n=1 Tax=Sporocytophaga myxococcoides TaxID=153721 RepID=A0A098LF88_9BACT|nr:DUF1801 domain-containing protein [Sporocytophaga myxococcoides]GAL85630.1 PF08818 domain protein [Sporocytophaga myxococcoides]